ncbi:hypothetical protein DFH09DRAFT_1404257 [Mycena vulgaris]|nr:hypothetical protein DFH09DRAFT_1404257 [Mycena vulgaris]
MQAHLNHLIAKSTYTLCLPVLPASGLDLLAANDDPEYFNCLETLGDARIAYIVSRLQVSYFPNTPLCDLKASFPPRIPALNSVLLSSETFQRLVVKLEIDFPGDKNAYCEEVGNAFKIYFEVFARVRGQGAASDWAADIFVPLIRGLLQSTTSAQSTGKTAREAGGEERREKTALAMAPASDQNIPCAGTPWGVDESQSMVIAHSVRTLPMRKRGRANSCKGARWSCVSADGAVSHAGLSHQQDAGSSRYRLTSNEIEEDPPRGNRLKNPQPTFSGCCLNGK